MATMVGIYGFKGLMWNLTKDGNLIAATSILPANCWISQVKSFETDGYNSLQVSYSKTNTKSVEDGCGEFRKDHHDPLLQSDTVVGKRIPPLELRFSVGENIRVVGKCIGKGFGGNQKRHNYQRGPLTHGSKNHRLPGSIGAGTTPGRVYPGKRMSGRHGSRRLALVTEIVHVSNSLKTFSVKGPLPGKHSNLLKIFKI
jgi:large subunit ribosomal protein L3